MNLTSSEGFLLSFKKPNMEKLRADAYSVVLQHHAKGHDNIKVQFRVCFWRKKYLMVSRIIIVGTDRETNKAIPIYKGTNAIKKWVAAKWKFDHAQVTGSQFEWNMMMFDCDGHNVSETTTFSEEVQRAAEKDIHSGIIDKSIKGLLSTLHDLTIGRYHKA